MLRGVSVLVPTVVTCSGRANASSSRWARGILGRGVWWWVRLRPVVMEHGTG